MYRAVAWSAVFRSIPLNDAKAVGQLAWDLKLEWRGHLLWCNDEDVSKVIRRPDIAAGASEVAVNPEVRRAMVSQQQSLAVGRNIVTEGRDQGSVVFPNAECKFFLTADPVKRAERRLSELHQRGHESTLAQVLQEIDDRDRRDKTREISPLLRADDAIEVDTSGRTPSQVIDWLEELAREKLGLQASCE